MSASLSALLPHSPQYFVDHLLALETHIRDALLASRSTVEERAAVSRESADGASYTGDTIYGIDVHAEEAVLEFCTEWARGLSQPFVLIAEGLPGLGRRVYPDGADEAEATFECIVDPIDGTRGIMYDKRSAWALAAVAPGSAVLGRRATMADLAVAVQVELPTSRARLADSWWAVAGQGAHGETLDLATGVRTRVQARPSAASTLAHGFATISKFFPGVKESAVWLEERLFAEVVGEHTGGAPLVFDDEYISSGGQLQELWRGHDRFVADLRPTLMDVQEASRGRPATRRLCARPYDLCTALIAQEAGVVVTDASGQPLASPLDTVSDVDWIGYANQAIRAQVEPVLQRLLEDLRRGAT